MVTDELNISLDNSSDFDIGLSDDALELSLENEGAGGGTDNYNELRNKPRIEGVELKDNKTFEDLNLNALTNIEIEHILN